MEEEKKEEQKPEPGLVKVAVSIPTEGRAPVEAYANRLENFMWLGSLQERGILLKENPRFEFYFLTLGRMFTPVAREEAADCTLQWGCDYLYMLDDDMTFPNDMFMRLYKHNVDIVGPLAFTRNYPHKPVIYEVEEDFDPVTRQYYFINHVVDNYPKETLVECDAIGFGAALIKRRVLEAMKKPRFMSTCGTGEDVYFCHRAKKMGFRVFMDTATKSGHLSHPIEVTEAYVEKVRKEFGYQEKIVMTSSYGSNGDKQKLMPGLVLGE